MNQSKLTNYEEELAILLEQAKAEYFCLEGSYATHLVCTKAFAKELQHWLRLVTRGLDGRQIDFWMDLEIQVSDKVAPMTFELQRLIPGSLKLPVDYSAILEIDSESEPEPKPDPINPNHYKVHPSGIECIQITEHMSFCLGNAVAYIWRAGIKTPNAIEDLKKAIWNIEREIQRLQR